MKNVKRFLAMCSILSLLVGCSPDIKEISDIDLVMATGIDYDKESNKYVFTIYCILPATTSTEKTGKPTELVDSAVGDSIVDAARNLRNRVGKSLVWQHNKFFIVGEAAARHSLYDVVDFLTRNRQIRITGHLLVSEGKAEDLLKRKTNISELTSNVLLGIVRNEKEWGKSYSLMIHKVADRYTNPYRGFVLGRIFASQKSNTSPSSLLLNGGAVINKGKFVDWLDGNEVRVVHWLSEKSKWKNYEFTETLDYKSTKVTCFLRISKREIQSDFIKGKPKLDVQLNFKATLGEINQHLALSDPVIFAQLEQVTSKHLEKIIHDCLTHFQQDLKVDLLGISDHFIQHHPKEWKKLKNEWVHVYPTMSIPVHVDVKIEKLGMTQIIGDQ
ncbi:spore germination protein KC [Paenibacillus sp. V4I3]|uniref:Ger(x)C family spore germination protein n=1 Tax=unclassified Paenibacillus TaxID=185978 RepID=UPI002788169A|nr:MULTISPECIES: Ger(x)C family spore germination protein [unclassified Paenibacillus]MDQ0874663.1 spore germination protein KC [Paenibacillus sp. V4I3]MDQ0889584.1 spore germination protein KC [Paenibacillus sp. V4I9]